MSEPLTLKVERWTSNDNQEEVHLYMPDERNTYVMGYNPEKLAPQDIEALLCEMGFRLP